MRHLITTALIACANPALAIDRCLVGVWQADTADLAHVMGTQMGGSASHISGSVSLEVTEHSVMTLLVDDFAVMTSLHGAPSTAITINGYSQGSMLAEDGRNYVAVAPEYSLIGSADILGQPFEISAAELSGGAWGQSSGTYGCRSDSVSFEANRLGSIPRKWVRVR